MQVSAYAKSLKYLDQLTLQATSISLLADLDNCVQ
jgi:hypothetical protein